ncbi:MAG: hypothetical protein ACFFEO_14490 [Candidatus Thorarchaeota archaeon]
MRDLEQAYKLYNQYMNGLNIDVILIIDEKSGLELFLQHSSKRDIDMAKISGFLQGLKHLKAIDGSATLEVEYEDSIILMTEFATLQTFLVMKESPPSSFLDFIEELSNSIYKNYGDVIKNYNGDIRSLRGIKTLVKHHFNKYFFHQTNKELNEKVLKKVEKQIEKEIKKQIEKEDKTRKKRKICPLCGSFYTVDLGESVLKYYISIIQIYAKKYFCWECSHEWTE